MFNKWQEILDKYQVLVQEVSKCYGQPVDIVPIIIIIIIIGHSSIVTADQKTYLK